MADFGAAAKRLQEVSSLEDLVGVLVDADVQALLAHPQVGEGWREFVERKRKEFSAPPAPPAAPSAAPAPEAPAPEAPAPEAPAPEAPAPEVLTAESQVPQTATAAQAAKPEALGIHDLVERSARAREDFYARMNRAYEELVTVLASEQLGIDPDAEYVDMSTDFAQKASTWLQVRIAKGEMTVEEAVTYAKKEGWTEVLTVRPDIYKAMMAAFQTAGLYLIRRTKVDGEEVDVRTALGQAIERGEITAEQAVELAQKAGWARPFEPRESSLEERLGPEKARELREIFRRRARRRRTK